MTEDLSARISEGSLDQHRVAIAAALGCEPAIATGVEPAVLNDHYRTRIEHIAACLTQRECIVFGYECELRALTAWEKVFPTDLRPRRAVEAVRVWLSGKDDAVDFDALSSGAGQSGIEVDYPELTEDVDPELCRGNGSRKCL